MLTFSSKPHLNVPSLLLVILRMMKRRNSETATLSLHAAKRPGGIVKNHRGNFSGTK